ncbi:LANO_0E13388g1_1 [Lachancea nothofagi CBS 11611]|uniref:LANO_0E13388g1_1 n=1 Tax=Lachancea nothofagi CBS 11611 TaxID=1266666 RepID=A0A1G4JYW4_9SACH|nr:LANO_0E13388g1_1 [Lachancea nothofagi CBS 11611]
MDIVLHLWGLDGKPSVVSPESVALFWLLNELDLKSRITVVFSNNTDLSPTQELPLLVNGVSRLSGFANIASFFCAPKSALETALLQFAQDHIGALTQYQLYLNRNNYDQFTRKVFAYLLQWPMWYNTPLTNRSLARKRCEALGYFGHADDEDHFEFDAEQIDELVQSKAFKLTKASKARKEDLLKSARFNLQYMNRLGDQIKCWLEAREKLEPQPVLASDYLVWANLFVQLELPDGNLVREHLQRTLGKDKYEVLAANLENCSQSTSRLYQRGPTFEERGNVVMSAYQAMCRLVAL